MSGLSHNRHVLFSVATATWRRTTSRTTRRAFSDESDGEEANASEVGEMHFGSGDLRTSVYVPM